MLAHHPPVVQNAPMTRHSAIARFATARPATVLLLLAALLLSACGFHLRNALMLPADLGPLLVTAKDPDSRLVLAVRQALERAGATMAADGATDVATLNLIGERWGNTPISVDQFGRAQEFSLRYAVIFNLRRADGSDLVPQQAIEMSRDYISVPTQSAGTEGERELLAKEMQRDMVTSILRRIDAVSRMGTVVPATTGAADPQRLEQQPVDGQPLDQQPVPADAQTP